MQSRYFSVGLSLIGVGFGLASIGGLVCLRRAFKENVLWGVACLLLPMATLIFPLFYWGKAKGLFYSQVIGMMIGIAGVALMFRDPDMRAGMAAVMDHRSEIALIDNELPDGASAMPNLPAWLTGALTGGLAAPKPSASPTPAATPKPTPLPSPSASPTPNPTPNPASIPSPSPR